MAKPVKGRRYDNTKREAQSREVKRRVVDAALEMFLAHGYPATTVNAIVESSGTPAPSIYRLFGSKVAIFEQVIDVVFGGDDEPIAFNERPAVLAAMAETDARRMLTAFATILREKIKDRSTPLLLALRSAAELDAEAAQLLERTQQQRHIGVSRIARELRSRDALPASVSLNEAADTIYALSSPEVHAILTIERGWSARRYEQWLARTLCATLLADEKP